MSAVNPVSPSYADQNASDAITKTTKELGQTEFLTLLVAQLQNQDPMNPMNNQDFIAQLATFSSLEQLISINKGITKLSGLTDAYSNENSF